MFNFRVSYGNGHFTTERCRRPLGSKNRSRGENSAMRSVILKVRAGTDLVVMTFAKENKVYMTVQGEMWRYPKHY